MTIYARNLEVNGPLATLWAQVVALENMILFFLGSG